MPVDSKLRSTVTSAWSEPSGCLVVMYHYVRDPQQTRFPSLNALHPLDFERQLDWLASSHRVIGDEEFREGLARGASLDGTALLTFDDGFVDHWQVSTSLCTRGWTGVFFVAGRALDTPPRLLNVHRTHFLIAHLGAAGFVDALRGMLAAEAPSAVSALSHRPEVYRYDDQGDLAAKHLLNYELPFDVADRVLEHLFTMHLGDETAFAGGLYLSHGQIEAMAAAGMVFGFHTESHRVLSRLGREEQRQELERGVDRIRALTGQASVPMCYPYGHPHTYDAATLDVLASCGYSVAFTARRSRAVPSLAARFEIPRFDTRDLPPFVNP